MTPSATAAHGMHRVIEALTIMQSGCPIRDRFWGKLIDG